MLRFRTGRTISVVVGTVAIANRRPRQTSKVKTAAASRSSRDCQRLALRLGIELLGLGKRSRSTPRGSEPGHVKTPASVEKKTPKVERLR
jgi:hypothetical protein